MKHITLDLTEDQARDLANAYSGLIETAESWLNMNHEWRKNIPRYWDKHQKMVERTNRVLAFRKRVLSKVNSELVKL